jgi:20S proteasome alpha/beta subunit
MMLGGDTWHVEEAFGAIGGARRLIGEVLEKKVAAGYFNAKDAERLAVKIFRENARAFFKLG